MREVIINDNYISYIYFLEKIVTIQNPVMKNGDCPV